MFVMMFFYFRTVLFSFWAGTLLLAIGILSSCSCYIRRSFVCFSGSVDAFSFFRFVGFVVGVSEQWRLFGRLSGFLLYLLGLVGKSL